MDFIRNESQADFDVEQWRIENPPDYFKAMELFMQSENGVVSDTIFDAIFRIFKLYVPDSLFKYQSLGVDAGIDELRLETLHNKSVYTAPILNLNDPFDSCGFFYRTDKISDGLRCDGATANNILNNFKAIRVASFTAANEQSMPMWAHYANNHQGFCVEYDMTSQNNETLKSHVFPIQYSETRVDLTPFILAKLRDEISRALLGLNDGKREVRINDKSLVYVPLLLSHIKHPSWSYEKEFRCTIPESSPIAPYFDAVPIGIYAGIKCSEENQQKLRDVGDCLGIPVYHMKLDSYDLNYTLSKERLI